MGPLTIASQKISVLSTSFPFAMPKAFFCHLLKSNKSSKKKRITTSQMQPTVSPHSPTNRGISSTSRLKLLWKCVPSRSMSWRFPLKGSTKTPLRPKTASQDQTKHITNISNRLFYVSTTSSKNYKCSLQSSSSTTNSKRKKSSGKTCTIEALLP